VGICGTEKPPNLLNVANKLMSPVWLINCKARVNDKKNRAFERNRLSLLLGQTLLTHHLLPL
jgi:hypothetical protein